MTQEISVKMDISLDATRVEITDIELLEGEMSGEVDNFLSIMKDVFE